MACSARKNTPVFLGNAGVFVFSRKQFAQTVSRGVQFA